MAGPGRETKRIGVADTMFARADMGGLAEKTLQASCEPVEVVRVTVPGIKDLPVACKKLVDEQACDLVLAFGMPGREAIDKQCAHEASQALQLVQLLTNVHVLEVFVHEDEGRDDRDLAGVMRHRTLRHTQNALDLLFHPERLRARAGTGQRQGRKNAPSFSLE